MKKMRFVMKLCMQSCEDFVKALAYTDGIDIVKITDDKRVAVVEMTDSLAEALNGMLFQVS